MKSPSKINRNLCMLKLYQYGFGLDEIGDIFDMTGEGVRCALLEYSEYREMVDKKFAVSKALREFLKS